jgi:hypothetical protein
LPALSEDYLQGLWLGADPWNAFKGHREVQVGELAILVVGAKQCDRGIARRRRGAVVRYATLLCVALELLYVVTVPVTEQVTAESVLQPAE